MTKQQQQTISSLRIIAGIWRGRKIAFNDCNGKVRPTPDRVRETLFNWLSPYIIGARCLDLYAGSGILGLEALSRQAASVVAVEQQRAICQAIKVAKEALQANLTLVQAKVDGWLGVGPALGISPFDLVFLDPPYADNALPTCFQLLNKNSWVKSGSLIYYEHNAAVDDKTLPAGWQVIKQSKAGNVYYYLAIVADKEA